MSGTGKNQGQSSRKPARGALPPLTEVNFSEWTRIGFAYPTAAFDTPSLFGYQIAPKKVLWVFTCLTIDSSAGLTKEAFEHNLTAVDQAVKNLAGAGAQFIVVGGSPMIRTRGYGFDKELIARLEALTGLPTTTVQTAPIEALRYLGVKKLSVATPYPKVLNDDIPKFLEPSGFTVLSIRGLGKHTALEVANTPSSEMYRLIKQVVQDNPAAEAVYVPGARVPVVNIIARLEAELGIPIVAAYPSYLWVALKRLQWKGEPVTGYGRLLEGLGKW